LKSERGFTYRKMPVDGGSKTLSRLRNLV
jgi:hypothetical protein